ncbi:putative RNA helicase [Coemansia sp. RSA 1813]|nr:putative RNA helicase [Coemansia sp. RSA 1646]KAJ1772727.1 putative RNA helicase [Coemansia sp. RSA 1843]KAJ2090679.1 putative RNA helicase [Coemansia sp. RSA 986]KAJ2216117.1 putative RNA helicase [Coemansia sp. RSA 487]KAJ2570102.1 putative RNA helicase [Coemansia sp. RSA 1813]
MAMSKVAKQTEHKHSKDVVVWQNEKVARDSEEEESDNTAEGDQIVVPRTSTSEGDSDKQEEKEYKVPAMCSFRELGLDQWLVDSLSAMAISRPTEIQRACIEPILAGRDVIGGAQTGSGKTAAFALPILQKLSEDPYGVFAVVLTPTRELAYQIAEQFEVLGKGVSLRVTVAIGGVDMVTQAIEMSRRPHIVVGTPGRLADLIESSSDAVHFQRVRYLVLDEADRLLTDTFASDLAVIMREIPKTRNTLLFTATMTPSILTLRNRSPQPFVHVCKSNIATVASLVQNYIFVPSHVKEAYLVHLLKSNVKKLEKRINAQLADSNDNDDNDTTDGEDNEDGTVGKDKSIIIFVGQCKTAESLRVMLFELGFRVTALHSKMPQRERLSSLGKFKAEAVRILIATDVGSRGLDIPSVELVINMHVPRDPDDYIHRVGRTARAGRGGRAITIMSERDIKLIHNIEARIGKQLGEFKIPERQVLEGMGAVLAAKRVAASHLLDIDFDARDRIRLQKRGIDKDNNSSIKERPKKRKH